MSRILSVLIALLVLNACASSADPNRASASEERIAQTLASLDGTLGLTDAQAERIRAILVADEANRPSGPPPRGGGQAGGVDPRAEREAQRAATDRQIEAVLTEAQVVAYREWRASQPQRREGPPPGQR